MKRYRILLIGDYSNLHSQLGKTLTAMGHDVTVMSEGSGFQNTDRDISIKRSGPSRFDGLKLAMRCMFPLHKNMRGYDIVAIQHEHFLSLAPKRLRYFFDRLCGENGAVFLSFAGTNVPYILEALNPNSSLKYNEYRIGTAHTDYYTNSSKNLSEWLTPEMRDYSEYVMQNIRGAVTALYEYDIAARTVLSSDKVAYGGIPIDVAAFKPVVIPEFADPVRFFLGRHRERQLEKGTDKLELAMRRVAKRMPGRTRLRVVENKPYDEYITTMASSHVLLDQIYSYSPATNALIAMAQGLSVVSGGESEYYDFIGETENRPIINAPTDFDELVETMYDVAINPEMLIERGQRSREFVEKHNAAPIVAKRYLDFWTSKL
jgi:glycosyltransferase involved in cell wall biosynthesis